MSLQGLTGAFLGEEAGKKVKTLLGELKNKRRKALLSEINLGELYYTIYRRKDQAAAEEAVDSIYQLPIVTIPINLDLIISAAKIKATKPISFADAFVIALAKKEKGIIVTHDEEFKLAEHEVKILWI